MPDLAARCRAARTLLLIARGSAESEPLVSAALALLDSALASFDAPPLAATEGVMLIDPSGGRPSPVSTHRDAAVADGRTAIRAAGARDGMPATATVPSPSGES